MDPLEFNKMIKKLRSGEKVQCPLCNKGTMISVGDCIKSHGFYCSHCKQKLNIN